MFFFFGRAKKKSRGVDCVQQSIYIYIYIYEIGSSHTWCNFYKLTHFLHRRFSRNLTIKKTSLNVIVFYLIT